MPGFSIPFALDIWKYIIKIRYGKRAFDHFHLLPAYYIFLREFLQNESIVFLYYSYILNIFEGYYKNVCQKTITTNSSFFRNTSNVSIFRYSLLKWMKYEKRPTFAYYSTTFWDFKSVPKTWQKLKGKYNLLKKMSKYRNTVYYDFKSQFLVIFSCNYRHRLVLKIPFP